MPKKLFSYLLIISLILLGGCGSQEESENDSHSGEGELTAINAELTVPEKAEAGEAVEFTTHVTQGDENVTDATEVKYEVWKEGNKEESEMIEAEHGEEGNYSVEKTFEEDGVYNVQVHVTARNMHTMPKTQISVGDVKTNHESHSTEEEGHDHGGVTIHFMEPENAKASETAELMASLEKGEEPLTQAQVRFEVWLDGKEKHEWVETEEAKDGTYSGNFEFTEAGMYHITVHVENDEGLHEHKEEMLTIQ